MLKLDMIQTLAMGGVALALGYAIRRAVAPLDRYNVPAPVLGGLVVAVATAAARAGGVELVSFDETLRAPLMIAFFTTIGFGASLRLLRTGGPQVAVFFFLCTVAAVLQNVVGAGVAVVAGEPALFGVLCGSVTLTGGPATGLAFAPQFEQAGVAGAEAVAVAAAMFGIVCGGLIGAPIGTLLIERQRRGATTSAAPARPANETAEDLIHDQHPSPAAEAPAGEDAESYAMIRSLGCILVAMGIGAWIGAAITSTGVILPAYIGAMLVAAGIRNLDDATGWLRLDLRLVDELGNAALAFFLVLALMTLRLETLGSVALPLLLVLVAQIALVAALCFWPIYPWSGRDYDAAVLSGGFCGFMLGTTANAMANMDALTRRFGPAPRAYLVVPMVGAFFIDFTNALLIQACLWLFG